MADKTDVLICVRFQRETPQGTFCDALHIPLSEYFDVTATGSIEKLVKQSEKDIESAIQQRVTKWQDQVAAASQVVTVEPTDDELFGQLPDDYIARLKSWAKSHGLGGD